MFLSLILILSGCSNANRISENTNKPTDVPTGGVQPSGAPPKPPAKDIKLDEYSANFVKRYGYSPDDIQRVLG